jgi:hypothetical protein
MNYHFKLALILMYWKEYLRAPLSLCGGEKFTTDYLGSPYDCRITFLRGLRGSLGIRITRGEGVNEGSLKGGFIGLVQINETRNESRWVSALESGDSEKGVGQLSMTASSVAWAFSAISTARR